MTVEEVEDDGGGTLKMTADEVEDDNQSMGSYLCGLND